MSNFLLLKETEKTIEGITRDEVAEFSFEIIKGYNTFVGYTVGCGCSGVTVTPIDEDKANVYVTVDISKAVGKTFKEGDVTKNATLYWRDPHNRLQLRALPLTCNMKIVSSDKSNV